MLTESLPALRVVDRAEVRRAREVELEAETYRRLAAVFGALGDATRARIVHLLLVREMCTSDLAIVSEVSESAVSQHLRVLRSLGLVRSRRAGKVVYHTLDDEHVAALVRTCLSHLGHRGAALIPARAAGTDEADDG